MIPEMNPMDPELERAVSEIRDEPIDPAVVEAAAGRVWERLAAQVQNDLPDTHIRSCADFQALIPEYRAGRLPEARALLLKDHLHQCVACRRFSEGKVVAFPAPHLAKSPSRPRYAVRWTAAAMAVAAAGAFAWVAIDRYGTRSGRAYIQALNGAIYEISATGVRPMAAGQDLPDGVAIRTAKDSYATVQLRDGSTVEVRERSEFSTSESGKDLTVHLNRGDLIFQAAKRRAGHLYVATADCRVAVTGTVFSVNAGVKGSRVSVVQGEVHVAQDNQDKLLRPGDQSVSGTNLSPAPIQYDMAWSRDTQRFAALKKAVPAGAVSPLLNRIPATAVFVALIPNAGTSLNEALTPLRQQAAQNPQLRAMLAGRGLEIQSVLGKLQAAGEYLDQLAIVGLAEAPAERHDVVFLASVKRPGIGEFLRKAGLPAAVQERPGLAAFGPEAAAVDAFARTLDVPQTGFQGSPCYERLVEAQREGAAAVACADLSRLNQEKQGARYMMGEDRQVNGTSESRLTLGFDGPRTGIAAWLAAPAPMGSLDYISPEATFLAAFVVKSPAAIVDELVGLQQRSKEGGQQALAEAQKQTGIDVRNDLAATLGGEFALAVDGPIIPTPSVKLIAEVYDPVRFQATLQKLVEVLNQERAKSGGKPLRMKPEAADGRTYYMIGAADPNPLTEVYYTFADGYLIAGWGSRPLVSQALQVKKAGTSIARSTAFMALMPRDHYANFSAVLYQNFGATLAPLAGLLGAFVPQQAQGHGNPLQALSNMKPTFVAAYGEPDRITVAGSGNMLGMSLSNLTSGSLLGLAGGALPFGQFQGTRGRLPAFVNR